MARRYLVLILAFVAPLLFGGVSTAAELDPSFGVGGASAYAHGGSTQNGWRVGDNAGQARALAFDSQNRILVGGGSGAAMLVVRYLPDGELDQSFGNGGVARFFEYQTSGSRSEDPDFVAPRVKSINVASDGRIIVVAQTYAFSSLSGAPRDAIFWLTDEGELDTSMGIPFSEKVGDYPNSIPRASAVDRHGNVFIAGQSISAIDDFGLPTQYSGYLMKRDPNGEWFEPFGGNRLLGDEIWQGVRVWTPKTYRQKSAVSSVKLLASGKILVGGHHDNRMFISRLTAAGKPDRSFGPWQGRKKSRNKGMSIADFGGKSCQCVSDAVLGTDQRGRIYLAGTAMYPYKDRIATIVVVRFLYNGAIDRSFGKNGFARTVRNPWVRATSIAIQRNGRIVVAARHGGDRDSNLMLVRFLNNGKLDKSFFNKGALIQDIGDSSSADQVKIDSKGRIVIAGGYSSDEKGNFLVERIVP